jgi:hypothetical protein
MVAAAVAFGTAWLFGLPAAIAVTALFAVHLLIGFEADEIHRLTLEQRGWQMIGSVTGSTPLECERRFFDIWLPANAVRIGGAGPAPNLPGSTVRLANRGAARNLLGWLPRRD